MNEHELSYEIILIPDEDTWMVTVPDLPGCVTYGHTKDEAKAMAKEAIEGVLASMRDRGLPIPAPSHVEIATVRISA
jgi:predicted RNase H-like HicB family nuclease